MPKCVCVWVCVFCCDFAFVCIHLLALMTVVGISRQFSRTGEDVISLVFSFELTSLLADDTTIMVSLIESKIRCIPIKREVQLPLGVRSAGLSVSTHSPRQPDRNCLHPSNIFASEIISVLQRFCHAMTLTYCCSFCFSPARTTASSPSERKCIGRVEFLWRKLVRFVSTILPEGMWFILAVNEKSARDERRQQRRHQQKRNGRRKTMLGARSDWQRGKRKNKRSTLYTEVYTSHAQHKQLYYFRRNYFEFSELYSVPSNRYVYTAQYDSFISGFEWSEYGAHAMFWHVSERAESRRALGGRLHCFICYFCASRYIFRILESTS